jgi:hypothetical protein
MRGYMGNFSEDSLKGWVRPGCDEDILWTVKSGDTRSGDCRREWNYEHKQY